MYIFIYRKRVTRPPSTSFRARQPRLDVIEMIDRDVGGIDDFPGASSKHRTFLFAVNSTTRINQRSIRLSNVFSVRAESFQRISSSKETATDSYI